jgi:predicted HicB family RNase H-like nuclease
MSGKYGDLIKQARLPETQKTDQATPTDQANETTEPATEPEVNLCVKVPISLRRHWASESKRSGVSMTSVIISALKARFGEPE